MNTLSISKYKPSKKDTYQNKHPTYTLLQFYFDYPTLLDKLQQVDRLKTLFKLLK